MRCLCNHRVSPPDPFDETPSPLGNDGFVPGAQTGFPRPLACKIELHSDPHPERAPTLPTSCAWGLKVGSVVHISQASDPSSPQMPAESFPAIYHQPSTTFRLTLLISLPAELADGVSNLSSRRMSAYPRRARCKAVDEPIVPAPPTMRILLSLGMGMGTSLQGLQWARLPNPSYMRLERRCPLDTTPRVAGGKRSCADMMTPILRTAISPLLTEDKVISRGGEIAHRAGYMRLE